LYRNRFAYPGTVAPADVMRRRTILVVNDEPGVQDLWAQILSEEGFRVLRARDAVEASTYLAIYRPTLAICKARLPGPDGVWLAEMIRSKSRATAVVLVEGESDADLRAALRDTNVAHVHGPRDREELLTTVRRAIEWNSHPAPAAH